MKKCCEGMLWRSVVVKWCRDCCREVLRGSVVEKCCEGALWTSVVEKCCAEAL